MFLENNVYKEYDQMTDTARVDDGGIVVDDARSLQTPETLVDRRRRQIHFFGQLTDGKPAIFLEEIQYTDVCSIKRERRGEPGRRGRCLFFFHTTGIDRKGRLYYKIYIKKSNVPKINRSQHKG